MSMWGDMPGGNAEPDPAFEPPTADQLAQWARDDAPNADHYYQVPARDQAERDAYDDIERVDAELAEARERSYHFHGTHVSDVPPHDYQCDDGCPYETDADRDARIAREEEYERLRDEEAREDEATSGPDSGVYGPQPPTIHDLWAAQAAPHDATLAGCSDDEYTRLVLGKQQPEAAYREASDRDFARTWDAGQEAEVDRATTYPTFDDDPALWGLRTEQYASYAAYVAEIEADREAGS